jgi:hypothetical protein
MGLREPLVVRSLATAQDDPARYGIGPQELDQLIAGQSRLWRRAFPGVGHTILKATSSAVRIGHRLLSAAPSAKAICLNVGLETYLATLLAGELSPLDLERHRPEREHRLAALLGVVAPSAQGPGEQAALAWTTESLSQAELSKAFGERILRVDFDRLLNDVADTLRVVTTHLDLSAAPSFFEQAPYSDVMRSYAKAPEAPYSALMRAQSLTEARSRFASEITLGLRWVDQLSRQSPSVAALLK